MNKKEFDKVLSFGGVNPAHKGQQGLLDKGALFADNIDFIVGRKNLLNRISYEKRREAFLNHFLQNIGL